MNTQASFTPERTETRIKMPVDQDLSEAIASLSEESAPARVPMKAESSPLQRVRERSAQRDALRDALETERLELTARLTANEAALVELGGVAVPSRAPEHRETAAPKGARAATTTRPGKPARKTDAPKTKWTPADLIVSFLRSSPGATMPQLLEECRASDRPAACIKSALTTLVRTGRVKHSGEKRHYRYSVAK
jgi:hypothetical protein